MVVAADEQPHSLFALAFGPRLAAGAATGGLKFADRHALEVAVFSQQHDRSLIGNQVDVFEAAFKIQDLGAARRVVTVLELPQLVFNDCQHTLTALKDVFVVGNFGDQVLVLEADLVGFQRR